MDVQLLGTGSADGWPNPFCACTSCSWAREAGEIRGQTSALIDGVVLIDCGPEIPRAAERHQARLDRVHTFVFTHTHPDHLGPIALLVRHWAGRAEPVTVIGPPAVVAACEPWVAPTDPVEFVVAEVGVQVTVNGYTYTPMSATHEGAEIGPAVIYAVESPADQRLLYASDTGPLSGATMSALRDFSFDVVLLEETFGDKADHGTDHLDLHTFPQALAGLRDVGAIDDKTDVVAVHLSHHNPPGPRLHKRLGAWGARVASDGEFVGQRPAKQSAMRRTFVLGGARSGKSSLAESLLMDKHRVTYVATAPSYPDDAEWRARIQTHQARRPKAWSLVETTDLAKQLEIATAGEYLLIDCLTLWLTSVLDETSAWDGDTTATNERITTLVYAWRNTKATVVGVSNEVGSGIVPATPAGRLFRDMQGRLNALIAKESDDVLYLVAGRAIHL